VGCRDHTSLLVCASAPLLTQFGMLDNHVLTWFSDSLLIAGLVWVLDPVRPVPRSRWLPTAIALGLLVALNLASDPLLYFGGIVPTLAGATIAGRRSANTRALEGVRYALLTCTIAVVGSIIVVHLIRQHRIVPSPGWTVGLAPGWEISQNATLWWQSLALLGGNAYSGGSTVLSLVHTAAAVLTVTAVAIIPCVVFVELRRGSTGKAANAERPPSVGSERPLGREAFVVAWGASGILVSAAFVLSTAPVGLGTTRYLVGVLMAAAALMPLLVRRRAGIVAVVTAAVVYCSRRCYLDRGGRGFSRRWDHSGTGRHVPAARSTGARQQRLHRLLGCCAAHMGNPLPATRLLHTALFHRYLSIRARL